MVSVARAELVYVGDDAGVTVIDSGTATILRTDPTFVPQALALSPEGRVLYLAISSPHSQVVATDATTGAVLQEYALASPPFDVALSGDGRRLWVWAHDGYQVLDTSALAEDTDGELSPAGGFLATNRDGSLAFVVHINLGGSLVAIDATTLEVVAEAGALYQANGILALHPDNETVYNLGWEFGPFVQITDPVRQRYGSLSERPFIGSYTSFRDIAFSADGTRGYIAHPSRSGSNLLILDTTAALNPTVLRFVDLNFAPSKIALGRRATQVYLTGSRWEKNLVAVFDTSTDQSRRLAVLPRPPHHLVVGPGGTVDIPATPAATATPSPSAAPADHSLERVYVTSQDGLIGLDARRHDIVQRIPLGAAGGLAAIGERLFVGSTDAQGVERLSRLDAATGQVLHSIAAPGVVHAIAGAPNGALWVSHSARCAEDGPCVGETGVTVFDSESLQVIGLPLVGDRRLTGPVAIGAGGGVAFHRSGFSSIGATDTASYEPLGWSPTVCCLSRVVAVHPNGHAVYALGNEFGGFVAVADWSGDGSYAPAVWVGNDPIRSDSETDIAFAGDGLRAYLPERSARLFVLDTSDPLNPSTERIIMLDHSPDRIALSADSSTAYLTNRSDASVSVVDLERGVVTDTVAVGQYPEAIVAVAIAAKDDGSDGFGSSGCQLADSARSGGTLPLLAPLLALALLAGFWKGAGRQFSNYPAARDIPRKGLEREPLPV
ncbi:MAG TPA: hypothetical protein VEB21_18635 [Terriglobales bacterium]|nr:hypothetical protein [Terriglobales bacterium]